MDAYGIGRGRGTTVGGITVPIWSDQIPTPNPRRQTDRHAENIPTLLCTYSSIQISMFWALNDSPKQPQCTQL